MAITLDVKVQAALSDVLTMFKTGDIPEAMARAMFPRSSTPCARYSLLNRLIVGHAGSCDVRGFKAWIAAGRHVKKGCHAVWIFAPITYRRKVEAKDGEAEKVVTFCRGFRPIPVFKVEDTEGAPVEYVEITPPPRPPLMDVAERLGIGVSYVPSGFGWAGQFSLATGDIQLASPEEEVFWHELGHAAHSRIEHLRGGQDPYQEIVAELAAIVLARFYGRKMNGLHFQYVADYAAREGKTAQEAVIHVVATVEKVLAVMIGNAGAEAREPAEAVAA